MQLSGDISVMDMGLYKATILNFTLNISAFGDAVTAVLSWPACQSMPKWPCGVGISSEKSSKVMQLSLIHI